jgi:succinyl-diaminopimelate desuccinylase
MKSMISSLLAKLISIESVTPNDHGCQNYIIDYLEQLGFFCQRFDNPPVSNFFARIGTGTPLLVFAGHTDVVPVGDDASWTSMPFQLTEKNGMAYGRGAADMKGSLASMLIMAKRFVDDHPTFLGSLGFLITSGEEGDDYDKGTPFVMDALHKQGINIDYCIVGEPSSSNKLGDVIRIGRRGSLNATLTLSGKQGHVAYPDLACNPIHKISPVLAELANTRWDNGNDYFPPTSLQITHIHSGGKATNIIPGTLTLKFNIRFSTEQTADNLITNVTECIKRHGLTPTIDWRLSGQPFLTKPGRLTASCQQAIATITHEKPLLSTSGGTSDARFIAPFNVEVIELGPVNATIHQVDECVSLADLDKLSAIYYAICCDLLVIS